MTLKELLQSFTAHPLAAVPVSGVACHSKQVKAGEVFVAVRGTSHDGHDFLSEAIQRGASALVVERPPVEHVGCPVVVIADTKRALSTIAARFYGNPADRLRLIGVTGTCGKTTTTYLVKAILEAAGHGVGLLGTVAYQIGERNLPSTNTTPGALELQRHLAQMVEHGLDSCVMEVSSHALDQGRIEGLRFDVAMFTNLGSDHLDYHKTRECYAAAKRRLFTYLRPKGFALINTDDPYGQTLASSLQGQSVVTYGVEQPAMIKVRHISCNWQDTSLVIDSPWGTLSARVPLVGRHNIPNIAAAVGTGLTLDIPARSIQQALANFLQVPGRMERIPNDTGIPVVIDYAHTADALRLALLSLRELVRGRLITVFGCGGNRDQTKRPVMGQMASLLADYVVLTSDNPRNEDPMDILHQIQAGFVPNFHDYEVVVDRAQAITTAISMARPDDAVLIAGKGHEAYQIFDHIAVPFSDRDVVERIFAQSAKAIAVA